MIEENFSLKHRNSFEVKCTLRMPHTERLLRLVIVAPGFLGFKDWGFFPCLCNCLAKSGFATLSFNHALCGVRENPYEITDYEGFSRNSTTQELKDWDLILDSILAGGIPHRRQIKVNALGVVGHSRGGSYGILLANRIPQIQSVVGWGAVATFQRFNRETQLRWRKAGYLELESDHSERKLRLNISALEELERNSDRLDVLKAMRGLSIPVLLLHGREDKTVRFDEGLELWKCADPYLSRFHIIESAGHTFKTQHPFAGASPFLTEAISETIYWFERTLRT